MQVEVYESLAQLPFSTAEALSYNNSRRFFQSIEWFRCLVTHGLDERLTPHIYIASDQAGPQCALFCGSDTPGKLVSLTNYYTMEFGPVMIGGDAIVGLQAIVSHIADERPRWNTIDLRVMRETDPARAQVMQLLRSNGFGTHAYAQYENWYLDINERSFDDYYNALSSRLRNTIKRRGRKLEREHEHELAIYPVDSVSFDDALGIYEKVYSGSWKEPEPYPDFMPELFRTCDKLGIVRIGTARIDGNAAAAQIWINDHGRAVIYKLAYDEQYARMSIGSLLSRRLFEHAIDNDRVHEIDYGVGSENYKRDWMNAKRDLGGVLACNRRTLAGFFVGLREKLADATRRMRHGEPAE